MIQDILPISLIEKNTPIDTTWLCHNMCYLLHLISTTDHLLSRDFVPSAIDAEELHQYHEREVRYELSDNIDISASPAHL